MVELKREKMNRTILFLLNSLFLRKNKIDFQSKSPYLKKKKKKSILQQNSIKFIFLLYKNKLEKKQVKTKVEIKIM